MNEIEFAAGTCKGLLLGFRTYEFDDSKVYCFYLLFLVFSLEVFE